MNTLYQFLRLIRISNIFVMILTMCLFYGMIYGFPQDLSFLKPGYVNPFLLQFGLEDTNFILLIISVVLIAASGNIINDYFDQKADRVNKPKRLIIGKYVKRRWAIILNWSFNGIGFLIAFYLSYSASNWWILLIAFLSINLLYFYSAIFKRKFLTGNLIVAFLTAIVPLYVFVYISFSDFSFSPIVPTNKEPYFSMYLKLTLVYASFAFMLNFIREVIKDMADVKGDLLLQSETLPIRLGFAKTKYILIAFYGITLIALGYFTYLQFLTTSNFSQNLNHLIVALLMVMTVIFILASFFVIVTKNQRKYYLLASFFIKLALLFGICTTIFFWK